MPRRHMKVSFYSFKCVKVRVGMRLCGCTHHPNRYVPAVGTIGWAGRAIPHNTCTSTFSTVKSNIEFQVSYRLVMSNNSPNRHKGEIEPIKDTRAGVGGRRKPKRARSPKWKSVDQDFRTIFRFWQSDMFSCFMLHFRTTNTERRLQRET